MMKKLRLTLIIAALSLVATALLPINAQAAGHKSNAGTWTPANTWYAAGSSAQFNTFAIAAGLDNAVGAGNPALCGEHHWTYTNGAQILDPRSTGNILPEKGNIWIVWDDNAQNQVVGKGTICFFISIDSIVGNRVFFANGTVQLLVTDPTPPATVADAGIVPLLAVDPNGLPASIWGVVNGALLNVCMTDIRPEDAKFATIRALTGPAGTRVPRTRYTGLGYGSGAPPTSGIGTPVYSSQGTTGSHKQANVVDFTISGPDPITLTGTPRPYTVLSVGASPVMVIVNVSNSSAGHLGDGNYTDINRYVLANYLTGEYTHIRQMAHVTGEPDVPIHVWHREPISGTYNTTEFTTVLTQEQYLTYNGPYAIGQETGVNPANTNCVTWPCTVNSGNPFFEVNAGRPKVVAARLESVLLHGRQRRHPRPCDRHDRNGFDGE